LLVVVTLAGGELLLGVGGAAFTAGLGLGDTCMCVEVRQHLKPGQQGKM
jgi:hypothetical protein